MYVFCDRVVVNIMRLTAKVHITSCFLCCFWHSRCFAVDMLRLGLEYVLCSQHITMCTCILLQSSLLLHSHAWGWCNSWLWTCVFLRHLTHYRVWNACERNDKGCKGFSPTPFHNRTLLFVVCCWKMKHELEELFITLWSVTSFQAWRNYVINTLVVTW